MRVCPLNRHTVACVLECMCMLYLDLDVHFTWVKVYVSFFGCLVLAIRDWLVLSWVLWFMSSLVKPGLCCFLHDDLVQVVTK